MLATRYGVGLDPVPIGVENVYEFGSIRWNMPSNWRLNQDVKDVTTGERVRTYDAKDTTSVMHAVELKCDSGDVVRCALNYRSERADGEIYDFESVTLPMIPSTEIFVASGPNEYTGRESVAVWIPAGEYVYELAKVSDADLATWLSMIDTITESK